MRLMKRSLSLLLSALLLLSAPAAVMAEESAASYYAGELTTTAIGDSYAAGNQINLDVTFGLDATKAFDDAKLQAAASLLAKSRLHMSFYDDFGTARVHAQLTTEGVDLLTADMLIYEDGSVQAMTNLTGKLVLALPAGTVSGGALNLEAVLGAKEYDYELETSEGRHAFRELPAMDRLKITAGDIFSTLINHLLGWVSATQMASGELYVFDDTYIEATDTRDAVAQRMIGTIRADEFNTLMWNIAATLSDSQGEFQRALADALAERGVTRHQARRFIDGLLTEETIDPMLDYVQTSYSVYQESEDALCELDDVSYFFKKLFKCMDNVWENSTDNTLHMDVSYDDFGTMVGFDAELAQFTTVLPYEGTFTYSIRTDDDWQQKHTAHGELQIDADRRVVGDLTVQDGEDVGGVNANAFLGHADVVNQADGTSAGVGVDAKLDYIVTVNGDGSESEQFDGSALLNLRENGEDASVLCATVSGMTTVDDTTFGLSATAALEVPGTATIIADATLEQAAYEEIVFAGGQAIDLSELTDEKKDAIRSEVVAQAAKLSLSLVLKPDVLSNLLTLFTL